jgi:hypothetical protein
MTNFQKLGPNKQTEYAKHLGTLFREDLNRAEVEAALHAYDIVRRRRYQR